MVVRKSPLFLLVGGLTEVALAPISWVSPAHSVLVLVFTCLLLGLHTPTPPDNHLSLLYLPIRALGRVDMLVSLVYTLLMLVVVAAPSKRVANKDGVVTPFIAGEGVLGVLVATLIVACASQSICLSNRGEEGWWSTITSVTCWVPNPTLAVVTSYALLVAVGKFKSH